MFFPEYGIENILCARLRLKCLFSFIKQYQFTKTPFIFLLVIIYLIHKVTSNMYACLCRNQFHINQLMKMCQWWTRNVTHVNLARPVHVNDVIDRPFYKQNMSTKMVLSCIRNLIRLWCLYVCLYHFPAAEYGDRIFMVLLILSTCNCWYLKLQPLIFAIITMLKVWAL